MSTRPRARFIHRVSGYLEVVSPLHMGTGTAAPGIDDTLQVDGTGALVIAGTGLAGALRARIPAFLDQRLRKQAATAGLADDHLPSGKVKELVDRLFGADAPPARTPDAPTPDPPPAGRVFVDDAPEVQLVDVTPGVQKDASPVAIWHGVGINARTGAAEPGVLYTRELVVPGTRFELTIEIEDATGPDHTGLPDSDERWLARSIAGLLTSGVALGRSTTTGLGRVQLRDATVTCTYDLTTRGGILKELAGERQEVPLPDVDALSCGPTEIVVAIEWKPTGTIMCGVETEGAVSLLPRTLKGPGATKGENTAVRLVLPGAGIKGALRKRAELIARTVASTTQPVESLGSLLKDNQDERLGAVLPLFGRPAREVRVAGKPAQLGVRGHLVVAPSTGTLPIPEEEWATLLGALQTQGDTEDDVDRARKSFRATVDTLNTRLRGVEFTVVDHVAIDRWTQGAATSRLFAALEPTTSSWEPLRLRLDLDGIADTDARDDMVALLLLVLRDLSEGWIPLGRGTRRGWGGVEVTKVACTVGKALDDLAALDGDIPMPGSRAPGDQDQNKLIEALITAWFDRQATRSGGQDD